MPIHKIQRHLLEIMGAADRLSTGNVAHHRVFIKGKAKEALESIQESVVGWLVEPLDKDGNVITWIKHFPTFISRLDYPDGPPKYGPDFKVTPLVKFKE